MQHPAPIATPAATNQPPNRTGVRVLGGLAFGGGFVALLLWDLSTGVDGFIKATAIAWPLIFLAPTILAGVLVLAVSVALLGGVLGAAFAPTLVDSTTELFKGAKRSRSKHSAGGHEPSDPWRPIGVAYKGQHIRVGGVDPWGRPWRPWGDDPTVTRPNPNHPEQVCEFHVYKLGVKDRDIVFAAAELSPSEFAFYLRTRSS